MHHSLIGGTGSGTGTLMAENIKMNFPKTPLISNAIYGSNKGEDQIVVGPYNVVLSS